MHGLIRWVFIAWMAVSAPALAQSNVHDGAAAIATAAEAPVGEVPVGEAAEKPETPEGVSAWVVSQGKTVTYRILASVDALVVGYLYTGSLIGGGGIALFNAVVSSTLYDLHEIAWNDFGPDPQTDPTGIAVVKTISYRMVSIANVLATGYYFTGNIMLSSGLALGNAVIDSTIYFFHELAWSHWGPPVKKDDFVRPDAAKEM